MMWGSTILLPLILLFYLMFQLFNVVVYNRFRCQLVPEAQISGEEDETPLSAFYQDGKIG